MSMWTNYTQSTPAGVAGGLYDLTDHVVDSRMNEAAGLKFGSNLLLKQPYLCTRYMYKVAIHRTITTMRTRCDTILYCINSLVNRSEIIIRASKPDL